MKVIELLNKIANGEIDTNIEFFYKKEKYRHIDNLFGDYYVEEVLNDEVEIVEPKDIEVCGTFFTRSEYNKLFKKDKKIEKYHHFYNKDAIEDYKLARFNANDMRIICNRIGWLMENNNVLGNKINEIIDKIGE